MPGKRKAPNGMSLAEVNKRMNEAMKKLEENGHGFRPKFNGHLSEKAAVKNSKERRLNANNL